MTDNEIIKALDFCCGNIINGEGCTETMCYQVGLPEDRNGDTRWCRQWLIKDALDLINRQKAEIERLKVELSARMELEKIARAEFTLLSAYFQVKIARGEAIKEFAERLKEKAFPDDSICTQMVVEVSDIDDLVKELTEPSLLDKKFGGDAE